MGKCAALVRRVVLAVTVCLVLGACGDDSVVDGDASGFRSLRWGAYTSVDVLLVVDNSRSMADKQTILAQAIPAMFRQLSQKVKAPLHATRDVHVGVISTSLGGHGGDECSKTGPSSSPDERDDAHLLGLSRPGLTSHDGLGFLWWDPNDFSGGETDLEGFVDHVADQIRSAGEEGCGYEAPLEAWYRFLVDPAPPLDVIVENGVAKKVGVDEVLLQQRKDFLRADSFVFVVMLSDENDCSIVDGGDGWLASQITGPNAQALHLPRGTSACEEDPNSPCCRSCGASETVAPEGCGQLKTDSACLEGPWDDLGDHPNLRCWQQKRRFGKSFLYPTRKYVEALTQPRICAEWDGEGPLGCSPSSRVDNPFLSKRGPNGVHLLGIVGVPWQDIAYEASLGGPGLSYQTELHHRWDWLIPNCLEKVNAAELLRPLMSLCDRWDLADEPDDPLMVESVVPRTGITPATKEPLAGPDSPYLGHPINGHEWNTSDADLQYACIFQLPEPRDCSLEPSNCACDDVASYYSAKNPLCQSPAGEYSTFQRFAGAHPGTRQLQVIHDLGSQAWVASICPKTLAGDPDAEAYGYNAAFRLLSERLTYEVDGPPTMIHCANRELELDTDGMAPCLVLDVRFDVETCDCTEPGLGPTTMARRKAAIAHLAREGYVCGSEAGPSCESACLCELDQLAGTQRGACQTEPYPDPKIVGWCPLTGNVGEWELSSWCQPGSILRFVGLPSAHLLVACGPG